MVKDTISLDWRYARDQHETSPRESAGHRDDKVMNPFRQTIVADPWNNPQDDVPEIHQDVFAAIINSLEQVRSSERSAAVLLHGQAGSGKTHLLSRLRSHLTLKFPTATDRQESLYVWVRLQTSPQMIWRTVRRTLVSDLFRPLSEGRCQFDRILFHRMAPYRPAEFDLEPWFEYMLDEYPDDLCGLIEQVATELNLDRNTHLAFEHLAFGRFRRDLKAWLSGESLPEAVLERMELTQEEGNDDEREDLARQVVIMLCRLAGNGLPIVLSFDQVEALALDANDKTAMFKFGQLVSTIHDNTTNVLVVSSVQSAFALDLEQDSRDADRDRITSAGKLSLATLQQDEAQALIRSRLAATGHRSPSDNPFWPLTAEDVENTFSSAAGITPRRLLALCAERFDASPVPPASSAPPPTPLSPPANTTSPQRRTVEQCLAETWEGMFKDKLQVNEPDHTEEILRHALPTAVRLIHAEAKSVDDEQLNDVSLILEHNNSRTGLSVCVQSNMTSLAARLKRLTAQLEMQRLNRLVIVRDHRSPVSEGAKKAKERLRKLEDKGATVVYPSREVLAALDALRALLSDAKSGDLSALGQTVSPTTLEEWFAAHLSYDIQEFVHEILAQTTKNGHSDTKLIESLSSLLIENPVAKIDFVAKQLGVASDDLIALANRHRDLLGTVGEPPELIFRIVDRS